MPSSTIKSLSLPGRLTLALSLLSAIVSAAPIEDTSSTYTCAADLDAQQSGPQCGNGQKLSCCNSGGGLLGLNCLGLPIREFFLLFLVLTVLVLDNEFPVSIISMRFFADDVPVAKK